MMNVYNTIVFIFIVLASTLAGMLLAVVAMKYFKKKFFPNWKFPDYISIGYAEYLYHKFVTNNINS